MPDSAQAAAIREYALSAQAAAQVAADVARLRPANFKSEVERLSRAVRAYLDHYQKFVHGKTGSEEAERRLRHVWVSINRDLTAAIQRWPSVTEQVLDKVVRFIEDFSAGAAEAWKNFLAWALKTADDTLRRYHAARVKIARLKRARVPDPEKAIPQAEKLLDTVRDIFRFATRADLDEIAQKEYGAYPGMGGLWVFGIVVVVTIAALAYLVGKATTFLDKFGEVSGNVAGVVSITAAGVGLVLFIASLAKRR